MKTHFNNYNVVKYILYITICFIFESCEKGNDPTELVVKKNRNYCYTNYLEASENMTYPVAFHESCMYEKLRDGCDGDWNKLFGFKGKEHHHINSARWAWKCYDGKLLVTTYTYSKGIISKNHKIVDIDIYTQYIFSIIKVGDSVKYYLDYDLIWTDYCKLKGDLRPLKPYFDGDCKAPHDIKIYFN